MINNLIKFIVLGVMLLAFSGCDVWDYGEHPQVTAIKKIADYADANDTKKAPDAKLYKTAGISIDGADINATNGYIQSLSSTEVDTKEKIQDIVDNIDELTAAPNEMPEAVISVASSTVEAGEFVYFDAIKSTDSDGEIVKYEWKDKNRVLATGLGYDAKLAIGRHIITLVVTDDDNGTGLAHTSVIVSREDTVVIPQNKKPTAVITVRDDNGTITLDSASSSDSDGDIDTYVWKEGAKTLASTKTYKVILEKGKHTISLTVTDNNGSSDTASEEIEVK